MRKEEVEIFSDTTNYAVMKHPGRHFPGSLIQGDDLFQLCQMADTSCREAKKGGRNEAFQLMNELRNALWYRLNHYKQVLGEHDIPVPFSEQPGPA